MAALKPPFQGMSEFSLARKIKEGKFDRLPKYSAELNRVIEWMLKIVPEDRPNVDDLLNIPQISFRIREKRLLENQKALQKKVKDFEKKELQVIVKEKNLKKLQISVNNKKKEIMEIKKKIDIIKSKKHLMTIDIKPNVYSIENKAFTTTYITTKLFDNVFSDKKEKQMNTIFNTININKLL